MNALVAYRNLRRAQCVRVWLLTSILLGVAVVTLFLGGLNLDWKSALFTDGSARQLLVQVRLPRLFAALSAGSALGLAGLVLQNTLRNPMASPYTLGLSGFSAFGAAVGIVFGGHSRALPIQASALISCLLCIALILAIAKAKGTEPTTIVLAGLMLNALAGAATAALQYFTDDQKASAILFWTFGDLERADWSRSTAILGTTVLASLWFFRKRWHFALLSAGDDHAHAGGVSPRRFRRQCLLLAGLLTALVVAQYGTIAFAGLVVPHLARTLIRDDGPWLFPATILTGSLFMILAATIARQLFFPIILPVGIVTAFCGAPFFLVLLTYRKEA